jgi:acyl-CoA synthetase (AMP-forming)/AMP-acid ligase II
MSLRSFTLRDIIDCNARFRGSKTAFLFQRERVTHAQYADRTRRLAAGLFAAGVRAEDRIAILAPNCLEYLDLLGAAAWLAAIVVPINWRLVSEEVAFILEDVAAKVLIVADEFRASVPQKATDGMLCYTVGTPEVPWRPIKELYVDSNPPLIEVTDDTRLMIVYTAATDGRPRGAVLSHAGLIGASTHMQLSWQLSPKDVNVGVLPLFHLAGVGLMLAAQHAGGATLLLPRFDAQNVVRHIDSDGGSMIGTYPPMLGALIDAAEAQGSRLPNLRVVMGLDSPETIIRLQASCLNATFWSIYGQTETSGPICLAAYSERPGSAGRLPFLNTVAIMDDFDRPVELGQTGEIVVRGPMVFHGYWRRDEDNAFTFRNGWHHTGDMGHIDHDGYLWYGGRTPSKELIKPGGENVYPAEIERAILHHSALAEAVIIGVPDSEWGEAIKAICVLKAGHTLSADELIEFIGGSIARYKKPKYVVFVEALPRTAAGLIDRNAVRADHSQA